MKKQFLIVVVVTSCFFATTLDVYSQNPPPHAKAHGVKKKQFYYYPDNDVYFDISLNRYTYKAGNRWISVNKLPTTFRLGSRVNIDFDGDDPWKNDKYYKEKYPPGQAKKKK